MVWAAGVGLDFALLYGLSSVLGRVWPRFDVDALNVPVGLAGHFC